MTMKFEYADFRSAGSYRYYHENQQGKQVSAFHGVIHEFTAPELIVQTSEFEGVPEKGHVVLESMLFESLPGERTRLTIHDVCSSASDRDMIVKSGMEIGLNEGFRRLDAILDGN
jgi:uncharacterized protein YndB with AHSA1/START domain